jgi:protein gp37
LAEFEIPNNVWMGTTVDCQARVAAAEEAFARVQARVKWLSIEPMIKPLTFNHLDRFDWMVIGGASKSSKTPEWKPPLSWVADLTRQADEADCRVFHKSNLLRKEEPGGPRYRFAEEAPVVFDYLRGRAEPAPLHTP